MATTIGSHTIATFTSPVNGTTPIDANTVRGNDNVIQTAYNAHDTDPGIHVQSSSLASRPVAGTAGRKWITEDSGVYTLWFDDGTNWHPVSSENIALTVLAGENLVKGDVVKVTGWNNGQDLPEVVKTTSAADTAFAVITATVSSGSMGYATNTGIVQDVNTAAYSVGTILYANGSGGFTSTKPTSGHYQPVAYVLRSNTNNGVYYVEFSTPRIVERSDNTASTVVLRDASGNFSAGTITAGALTSTGLVTFASLKGTGATTVTDILNDSTMATASATTLATSASIKTYVDNKVATVDTLAEVLANGNTTGANDIIVNAGQKIRTPAVAAQDGTSAISIANSTGALTLNTALADSNLATISTAGKVSNSATTATSANTASAIVARDGSGNFSAGTITATLNGAAPAGSLSGSTLASGVTASSLTSVGTLTSLTVSGQITANGGVQVRNGSFGAGRIYQDGGLGLVTATLAGSTNDWTLVNPTGTNIIAQVVAGTTAFDIVGNATVGGTLSVGSNLTVDTNTLFVDATNNRVGVGTASPSHEIHVIGSTTGRIQVEGSNGFGMVFVQASSGQSAQLQLNSNGGSGRRYAVVSTASGTFAISDETAAATRLTVDTSGNLGLGVTPSAWTNGRRALQIGGDTVSALGLSSAISEILSNVYVNSGAYKYANAGPAGIADFNNAASGGFSWRVAASGSADAAITFTQAMTLDASGNLLVGKTAAGVGVDGAQFLLSGFSGVSASGTTAFFVNRNTNDGTVLAIGRNGVAEATLGITSGALTFGVNSAERARIDASGNLGLGVTPSAWSGGRAIEVGVLGNCLWGFGANELYQLSNAYFNAGFKYAAAGTATQYLQYNGTHQWSTAASGTAGNAITFTQAMTLDANGLLGVGTASPSFRLHAQVASGADRDIFIAGVGGTSNGFTVKWNHANTNTYVGIANIPTSSAGLPAGTLYSDGGTIKIA